MKTIIRNLSGPKVPLEFGLGSATDISLKDGTPAYIVKVEYSGEDASGTISTLIFPHNGVTYMVGVTDDGADEENISMIRNSLTY